MRAFRISVVWLLLFASSARAQDIPLELRRPLLLSGLKGVGGAVIFAAFGAGIGALALYGSCADNDEDGFCDERHVAAAGALVGSVLGYVVGISFAMPAAFEHVGKEHQLRGSSGWVFTMALASVLVTLSFTFVAMATYQDEGPRAVAPIATAGILASMAAPWGLGYVVYRGTHRRAVARMISPTGFGVRF